MKYKVQVGSFVTRMVTRNLVVYAENEDEAGEKAIEKYIKEELRLNCASDAGTPQVDFVEAGK